MQYNMAKEVIWTDKKGKKHRAIVKDGMVDPAQGYQQDPPDIFELDWEQIKLDLHNQLVNRRLFTIEDVIAQQNGLAGAIIGALRKKVKALYREDYNA